MKLQELQASDFVRMPMTELTTPRNGRRCIANHWWAITEDGDALFYAPVRYGRRKYWSPQCNTSKSLVEHISKDRVIETHPVFIAVAFVPEWESCI